MRKSKVQKMKLASLLLLSTVLIPNIAYADEEIDESMEAETAVNQAEIQDAEQTINEQETESEENAGTPEITPGEAATEEVTPDVNTYNNDIETNTENAEEETVDDSGGKNEETAPILQPAEPEEQPEENQVVTPEELESNEETAQEEEETEVPAGEEETPADAVEGTESETDSTLETPVTEEPDNGTQQGNIDDNQEAVPELPIEQIDPIESVDPEGESSTEEPSAEENTVTEQPEEGTVEENPSTVETEKKKLYRYDYGDILNGISFSEESIHDDLSTLDQRVSRVMSSKIIEEKDLTAEQKLELEEKVKAEQTTSYDAEELPNTGEADSTNYVFAGLLTIFGAVLLFMSKKLKTDN